MGLTELRRPCGICWSLFTILIMVFIVAYPWYYHQYTIQYQSPSPVEEIETGQQVITTASDNSTSSQITAEIEITDQISITEEIVTDTEVVTSGSEEPVSTTEEIITSGSEEPVSTTEEVATTEEVVSTTEEVVSTTEEIVTTSEEIVTTSEEVVTTSEETGVEKIEEQGNHSRNRTNSVSEFDNSYCRINVWVGWYRSYCDTSKDCDNFVVANNLTFDPSTFCSTFFPNDWRERTVFTQDNENFETLTNGTFGIILTSLVCLVIASLSFCLPEEVVASKKALNFIFAFLAFSGLVLLFASTIYYSTEFTRIK